MLVVHQPLVMGIINATPDSFYQGSRFADTSAILLKAQKMIAEGADIIDMGGQSTRPGSEQISEHEELNRVIEGVEAIHRKFPDTIVSIDTYHASVAKHCVEAGASIINDVSGGAMDKNMIPTVASLHTPYVLMHMKGTPATMQQESNYENVTREVFDFFVRKKEECRKAGIHDLIIDPGIGFAKTINHNFELLRNLNVFKMLEAPVMIGVSRKSSVYKSLGVTPEDALNGTTVLNTIALMNGANILRVHDVKAAKEAVKLWSLVNTG